MSEPKISIVVPFHWMKNWEYFLSRCIKSIEAQSFTDYEIILMKVDSMPVTTNRAIMAAKGELVKLLMMDDYLATGNSLQEIVDNFGSKDHWMVSGCVHQGDEGNPGNYHAPQYSPNMHKGDNRIGCPSVLTMRRVGCPLFDENLIWMVDCDLYKRLHDIYGEPKILNTPNIVIGLHADQASNTMLNETKAFEENYMLRKHS